MKNISSINSLAFFNLILAKLKKITSPKSFTIVCFIIFILGYQVSAQETIVLKPIGGSTIDSKNYFKTSEPITNSFDWTDTISYRQTSGAFYDINFGMFGNEYIVLWYQAPTDMIIKAIGGAFAENNNNVIGRFKLYKVGNEITFNDLFSISTEVKQGRYVSADSSYGMGYVGFETESDGSGYQNVGTLPAFPFAEEIWSDSGNGYTFTPVPTSRTSPTYQFIETYNLGFEPTVGMGEIFAVVFKNESPNFASDRIGIWANDATNWNTPFSWKFYPYGRTTGDTSTVYWYTRNATPDFVVLALFYETNIHETGNNVPNEFCLSQNYPNPYNPNTKISWQSPVTRHQTLKIYDVLGNDVATLVNEYRNAGSYEIDFDASRLSSGVYFYQLKAGEFVQSKKMLLIK